jgi:hypothetical protein
MTLFNDMMYNLFIYSYQERDRWAEKAMPSSVYFFQFYMRHVLVAGNSLQPRGNLMILSVCNHTPTTIASVFLRLRDQTEGGAMDGTSVNGRPQKESMCDCSRGRSAGESGFKHTQPSQRLQRRGLMKRLLFFIGLRYSLSPPVMELQRNPLIV